MIMTYDWMIYAQNHLKFKTEVENIIASGKDTEITCRGIYRLIFHGSEKLVVVKPYSDTSDFCHKIIPMKIAYRAVLQMMNGDWTNINEEDIGELEESY